MVPKKDPGDWRPCGDYGALDFRTLHKRFPLPHIQDLTANPSAATTFSKTDLVKAYHDNPLAPEDTPKHP